MIGKDNSHQWRESLGDHGGGRSDNERIAGRELTLEGRSMPLRMARTDLNLTEDRPPL